jgi:urate oxidase
VYSQLQATIYDAGSLCLAAVPELTRIAISTPNLHYLPTTQLLKAVGVASKDTT